MSISFFCIFQGRERRHEIVLKIPLQSDESRTIICRNNCLIDRRLNKFKETLPAHGKPKPFRKQKKEANYKHIGFG